MLDRLRTNLLLVLVGFVVLSPANAFDLPNASSLKNPGLGFANASCTTITDNCFDPSFASRLIPAKHQDCVNAAGQILEYLAYPRIPHLFARKREVKSSLPWVFRNGTCVIWIDVPKDDDKDYFPPWTAYSAALSLANVCVNHGHHLGGKMTVGPLKLATLIVFGRNLPPKEEGGEIGGLVFNGSNADSLVARGEKVVPLEMEDGSSRELIGRSNLELPSLKPSSICSDVDIVPRTIAPIEAPDCYQAADEIIANRQRNVPLKVGRHSETDFRLPSRHHHGTCGIRIDIYEDQEDVFDLWTLYGGILDLAFSCTRGPTQHQNIWGGERNVGSKGLVVIGVFGRTPAGAVQRPMISDNSRNSTSNQTKSTIQVEGDVPTPGAKGSLVNVLAVDTAQGANMSTAHFNVSSVLGTPSLGGIIECYDPPMQRERSYPINIAECEYAITEIIGQKNKYDFYTFSRRQTKNPFYYPVPARFTHGGCVVLLDMVNDKDEDRVRLACVEASAWILAHKCSGEDAPQQKYGGSMTVSAGAHDLIRVWVYSPGPSSPSTTPILSLSHNRSSIDVQ